MKSGTSVKPVACSLVLLSFVFCSPCMAQRINVNNNLWDVETTQWNGDDLPDLVMVKKQAAGKTEVHIFSAGSNYNQSLLQVVTCLHATNKNWEFDILDWNMDGTPDLWAINKRAAGKVDLHILSGATNFQTFLLHTRTPLGSVGEEGEFLAVPPTGIAPDQPILMLVLRANTGSRKTEVHLLNGGALFQEFALRTSTALHETGTGPTWQFQCGDFDGDAQIDLLAVTSQGNGEVHVMSGQSQFKQFSFQADVTKNEFKDMTLAAGRTIATCLGAAAVKVGLVVQAGLVPPTGGLSLAAMLATYAAGISADMMCIADSTELVLMIRERRERKAREEAARRGNGSGDIQGDHVRDREREPLPDFELRIDRLGPSGGD